MNSAALFRLLADLTLIAHALLVMFVIGGQLVIFAGWARAWEWTRDVAFRTAHLLSIGVVMLEAWWGVTCPLTVLEDRLRARAGESGYRVGFIADWLHRLLFYSAPDWVFTLLYTLFAMAVLATYLLYPPRFRHG